MIPCALQEHTVKSSKTMPGNDSRMGEGRGGAEGAPCDYSLSHRLLLSAALHPQNCSTVE